MRQYREWATTTVAQLPIMQEAPRTDHCPVTSSP